MRAEWETDPIVVGRASREFPVHKFSTDHIVPSLVVVLYCSVHFDNCFACYCSPR
jgi:hypothetical protein